jgi:two-component system, NarL family, response regulator LiaR
MRQIVLYGLILGALFLLLQYIQYRLLFLQHAESIYTGVVAAICCVAGIWAGIVLTQKFQKKAVTDLEQTQQIISAFSSNQKSILAFNISQRELEVLQLMADGLSNQQIADTLFISLNTVKTHTSNVFSKLDVQRRTQAIQKAKALELIA